MLNQDELAELVGIDQARISRYEKCEEVPALAVALALQVIFGIGPRCMFSRYYAHVEEEVMRRAAEFERRLAGKSDFKSVKKRQLFEAMAARATNSTAA
jgi:transcriptional regulator with XRE-family HTH domain